MAYNPSQNYQLVKTGSWAENAGPGKQPGAVSLRDCQAMCDSNPNCDGFTYWPNQRRCENYRGTKFDRTHGTDGNAQLFRKTRQQPMGTGKYQGKPTQIGGCCGPISSSTFALQQGARQPAIPNTNGRGSCSGFNGYGDWKGWDNGFGATLPGNGCPESFDISMCPGNLGTPKGGSYVTSTGAPGFDNPSLYSACQYDELNWPSLISMGAFNDSIGNQLLTDASWKQAKNDYCANWNNIDKPECIQWLRPENEGARSFNTVKMGLCTPPNVADWTKDTRCVNAINQVFKTGSESEKSMANPMVNVACGTNPNSPACACYNAANRTTDQCLASPTLPGCTSIADKVGKYKSLGATFLSTTIKPFCACDECTVAKTGSSGTVISQPAADQPGLCTDKINACFQQMTIGQMSGGTLNAGCTIQDINPPPPPPPGAPPPPPGAPPPPPGAPSSTPGSPPSTDTLWSPKLIPGVDTKEKQYGAVGGLVFLILCCCCLALLLLTGGGSGGSSGPGASNVALARLMTAGG